MIAVFLGPPGAGKGTQAAKLAAKYGTPHVSTGDMLRDAVAAGSDLGLRVRSIMDAGELVDDVTMGEVIRTRLAQPDAAGGVILDGYPRNSGQAEFLDSLLAGTSHRGVDLALQLSVPEQYLVDRLSQRRACPQCNAGYHLAYKMPSVQGVCDLCQAPLMQREDDREDVVRERLRVYQEATAPLVEYYENKGILRAIDGVGSIEAVFDRADTAMGQAVRA